MKILSNHCHLNDYLFIKKNSKENGTKHLIKPMVFANKKFAIINCVVLHNVLESAYLLKLTLHSHSNCPFAQNYVENSLKCVCCVILVVDMWLDILLFAYLQIFHHSGEYLVIL